MSDVQGETIAALLDARLAATPQLIACSVQEGERWRSLSWSEVGTRLSGARAQLLALGVTPGSTVAIMAPNSLEWDLVHLSALQLGAKVIGLDAADQPENLGEVVAQTKPVVLAVANAEALSRIATPLDSIRVLTLPLAQSGDDTSARLEVKPSDVATTIFTSGTTGKPKGISYTHRQVVLAVQSICEQIPELVEGDRVPCWLPQAHLFQRIINLCALVRGLHVFYVEKPLEFAKLLPTIEPHFIVGVPRFFERVWAGITEKIDSKSAPIRRIAQWALRTGKQASVLRRQGVVPSATLLLKLALADRLVLSSIRRALGGHLRFMISGAAPLPTWLLEEFHSVGLLVLEAYGLSENVVPNAMNTPREFRFGTVGKPLPLTQLRVAEDGEVMVKGEGVFSGYEHATSSPLTHDGWLPTGDLGSLDANGFLSLVGRKSEVVKTSTGRKVALPAIEAVLRKVSWVELPVVFALGRNTPVAVLYVNLVRLGVSEGELEKALPRVRAELAAVCEELATFLRPTGVVLVTRAPSLETMELTANLKVRRAVVERLFAAALEASNETLPKWFAELHAMAVST